MKFKNTYKMNEEQALIPWVLRVPIWKMDFCSSFLWLALLPWFRKKAAIAMSC